MGQRAGQGEAEALGIQGGERFGQHRIAHQFKAHLPLPPQPGDQGWGDGAQILPVPEGSPPADHQGPLGAGGSRGGEGAQRRQLLQLIRHHLHLLGPIRQPLAQGLGGHLGGIAAAD